MTKPRKPNNLQARNSIDFFIRVKVLARQLALPSFEIGRPVRNSTGNSLAARLQRSPTELPPRYFFSIAEPSRVFTVAELKKGGRHAKSQNNDRCALPVFSSDVCCTFTRNIAIVPSSFPLPIDHRSLGITQQRLLNQSYWRLLST